MFGNKLLMSINNYQLQLSIYQSHQAFIQDFGSDGAEFRECHQISILTHHIDCNDKRSSLVKYIRHVETRSSQTK